MRQGCLARRLGAWCVDLAYGWMLWHVLWGMNAGRVLSFWCGVWWIGAGRPWRSDKVETPEGCSFAALGHLFDGREGKLRIPGRVEC